MESFSEAVRNPYFSYACMGFILLSCALTKGRFKLIPIIMISEFVVSKLCFLLGRVETKDLSEEKLFIGYALISLLAIVALYRVKLSVIAAMLFFVSTIYNLLASLTYFFYYEFISIYTILPEFMGTIMILQTLLCLFMAAYVEFNLRKYGSINGYNHMYSNWLLRSSLFGRINSGAVS